MPEFHAAISHNGVEQPLSPIQVEPRDAPDALVSCLMVTRGRLFPAQFAVQCFLAQSHTNRELVVVVDDERCELLPYIEALNDQRIRVVQVAPGATLGELRNLSIQAARGTYVCQWDDDDLYAPERIQTQLAVLRATGTAACLLRRWTLWWPHARRLAVSGARLWEGSMLALKSAIPTYPAKRRGEDTEMMRNLQRSQRLALLEAPELYVYVRHGNNTFDEHHFFEIYNYSRLRWMGAAYEQQLGELAKSMPVGPYRNAHTLIVGEATPSEMPTAPVSVIVRSMGRPELRVALESLAAQDYPALDVIVVDATGGAHPPLPTVNWRSGHHARLVSVGRPLLRPHAANVGLDAVTGEWFGFLDDDDWFDPDHISTLMRAARTTEKLVVYGMSRLIDATGETTSLSGMPFNRAIMFHGPLMCFPTALVHRKVIALGCRFDERFEISEDRDFFQQIAEHSDFEHVKHVGFNYRVELGTSGTGRGPNRDALRLQRFEELLQSKWYGQGTYHRSRTVQANRRAIECYQAGNAEAARAIFQRVLDNYPDDANALNGLGYVALNHGELDAAHAYFRRAVEVNPVFGEARVHLATTLQRLGRIEDATDEARRALDDPAAHAAAMALLTRLGAVVAPPSSTATYSHRPVAATTVKQHATAVTAAAAVSRTAPCPCGSGKRYKECCGKLSRNAPGGNSDGQRGSGSAGAPVASGLHGTTAESIAREAVQALGRGDAGSAVRLLSTVAASDLQRAESALDCAGICVQLARYEEAYAFYQRANVLGAPDHALRGVAAAFRLLHRRLRDESVARTIDRWMERKSTSSVRAATTAPSDIHVVTSLLKMGGTEQQALNLAVRLDKCFAGERKVRLWSVVPPFAYFERAYPVTLIDAVSGQFPQAGHVIVVGAYFELGNWLARCNAHRVTIYHTADLGDCLVERLVELDDLPAPAVVDFTFPSLYFKRLCGLDGIVDYPLPDLEHFRYRGGRRPNVASLVIGRHSRDVPEKFHPNDPSFFRRLVQNGHTIRIVGGTCLRGTLLSADHPAIDLQPERVDGLLEFLATLDCFIYRIHPHLVEAGGMVIAEAMAMCLPVVVFADRVGFAELITHGRDGFVVNSEDEALECIERLAADPRLREEIGLAARATIEKLAAKQDSDVDWFR